MFTSLIRGILPAAQTPSRRHRRQAAAPALVSSSYGFGQSLDISTHVKQTAACAGEHSVRGALAAAHAGTRLPGSATACVIRLDRAHSKLFAANLVRSCLADARGLRGSNMSGAGTGMQAPSTHAGPSQGLGSLGCTCSAPRPGRSIPLPALLGIHQLSADSSVHGHHA